MLPWARGPLLFLLSSLVLGFDWPSRSTQLVSALTAAETPRERRDALRRIGELDTPLAFEAVRAMLSNSDPEVRVEALRVLGRAGAAATPELVAACSDRAPEVRAAAVSELGRRAQAADIELLLRGAADPDPRVRIASFGALTWRAGEAALAALAAGLADSAIEVRVAAVKALAARAEPPARSVLQQAFDAALPEVRTAILDALGAELADRAALALAIAVDDPDEQVVLAALRSYARANTAPPRERLAALTSSPSPQIAAAAQRLLARATAAPRADGATLWLPALERTAQRALSAEQSAATLEELERALPAGEPLSTDALMEWLAHAPTVLRRRIVALVARSAGDVRTNDIVPLLAGADAALRSDLVGLLAQARDASAHDILAQALDDADAQVRSTAAHVLSTRLDSQLIDRLTARMHEANDQKRGELTALLAESLPRLARALTRAQREELCDVLDPRELDVRAASLRLRALGAIDHGCARARIRGALSDPRELVQIAALRASVADHGARARALRQRAIDHRNARLAATALIAATLASDPLESAKLRGLLVRARWPLRPAVAFALASTEVVPALAHDELCELRDSPEPATRSDALVALSRHAAQSCSNAPEQLLETSRAWPVRRAAAIWAHARGRLTNTQSEQAALARCREHEHDAKVRDACTGNPSSTVSLQPADHARALVLQDGRVLISLPDGSGDVTWPAITAIASLPAWFAPYSRE